MDVIHSIHGATDPLAAFDACGVSFLPLTEGGGDSHLSCAHLDPGATIEAPSLTHAAALLIVHGRVTLCTEDLMSRFDLSAGVGAVLQREERYSLSSDAGAIVLILEADELTPHPRGISSPERIAGQSWPGGPEPPAALD